MDQLSLARAGLYGAILGDSALPDPDSVLEEALRGLRQAGAMNHLPKALLTSSLCAEFGMRNAELEGTGNAGGSGPGAVFLDEGGGDCATGADAVVSGGCASAPGAIIPGPGFIEEGSGADREAWVLEEEGGVGGCGGGDSVNGER